MPSYRYLLPFALALLPLAVIAQFQERGIPYSHYYSPREYHANPQNWIAIQRANGVMSFGNGDGILTFNGERWGLTPLPNNNLVRSLCENDGILYAGGYNEIGYLLEEMPGSPRYVTLSDKLPQNQQDFGHVWSVVKHEGSLFFTTDKGILIWKEDHFDSLIIDPSYPRLYHGVCNDTMFIQPARSGLSVVRDRKVLSLEGGDFYQDKRITTILPYAEDVKMVCTLEHGVYLYDGKNSLPFQTPATSFLRENRLYKGIRLSNGNYVFGTLNAGVVIAERDGSVLQLIDKKSGLGDNAVYNLTEDNEGGLWVTHSVGITRLDVTKPFTWFDSRNGLEGAVNDIIRFEGDLYVATMLGLYKLIPASSFEKTARFEKVTTVTSSVWAMAKGHGALLMVTDDGTLKLKDGKFTTIDQYSGAVMHASALDPDVIFVGLVDGLVVLKHKNGKWQSSEPVTGVEADIGEICEDKNGTLWLGTFSEGVVHLEFPHHGPGPDHHHPVITRYGEESGLPVGYVQIHRIGDEVLFRVEPATTLYRFDGTDKKFKVYEGTVAGIDSGSPPSVPLTNQVNGRYWLMQRDHKNEYYDILNCGEDTKPPCRFISFRRVREDVDEVVLTEEEQVWMGGLDGVVSFRYTKQTQDPLRFNLVMDVMRLEDDSVLYAGSGSALQALTFPYSDNSLSFSFAGTTYKLPGTVEYQYYLEGFDDSWSGWTRDSEKSYTRVREGTYVLKVRARDIHNTISEETIYAFTIQPPWYRHWIAYFTYAVGVAALVLGIARVRSYKLEKEKVRLENVVRERTAEVAEKNHQLEQQAEELKTHAEQLKELDKLKSHFFANISHEFRTPLSLILAPLETGLPEGITKPELDMMYRNAKRLQRLINQLLDLSKLEAGEMRVFLSHDDLTPFVSNVTASFQLIAESKDIRFDVAVPSGPVHANFDPEKLETILYNLLSNAFKFTPEGGEVSLELSTVSKDAYRIEVTDSGPGIPSDETDRIFSRFYQIDSGAQRRYEGSGIGLALTRELVTLLGGDIQVESQPVRGTRFTVTLPKGENASPTYFSDLLPETPHPVMRAEPAQEIRTRTESPVLLLVEDNADLASYLAGVLGREYDVTVMANGEEGHNAARELMPDLIVSDMMMPKMDGFAFCEAVRADERTSHIPFILLTARANIESRLAGLELGADDYLTKPFNLKELQVRIANLLRQRELLRRRFSQEPALALSDVAVTSADQRFLQKVSEAIEANLSNGGFSIEDLSALAGMSRKHLHRKLVALVGQPPNEFVRTLRLKRAHQLLEADASSVKEVAFAVGFNNLSYFSKCFREQFGVSPGEVKPVNPA